MWYRKAKRYLVAAAFSVVLLVLSTQAGSSIVSAATNDYRGASYDQQGWRYEPWREHRGWDRHLRRERQEWRRHDRAGYYDPYSYFHPYRY